MPLPFGTALTWTVTNSFLAACRRRYGSVFTVRSFPWGKAVFVSEPELVKLIFTGDPAVLHAGEGNRVLAPVVGDRSILLLDEDSHMKARKRLLAPFHGDATDGYARAIERIVAEEVERWPLGIPFPLYPRMSAITFDAVLRAVLGVTDPERAQGLRRVLPQAADWDPTILAMWAIPGLSRIGRWRAHERAVRETDRLLDEEIAARRSDPRLAERDDVLSQLVRCGEADDRELRDDVKTLLIAGDGTSAAGLAWAFERLLRHPAALRRARELDGAYLDAVVQETLRVRPPIPAVARQLQSPMELGGWLLPAGVTVVPAVSLLHSDPSLYPEPDRFRPERFLDRGSSLTYTWIPFGGGRRRCLGAAFAALEMRIVLRTVLARTTLRADRAAGERMRHRNITLVPARGGRVIRMA